MPRAGPQCKEYEAWWQTAPQEPEVLARNRFHATDSSELESLQGTSSKSGLWSGAHHTQFLETDQSLKHSLSLT